MALFIVAVIVFIIADILIRLVIKKTRDKKIQKERMEVLEVSLEIDLSKEAKTLKRANVENPVAKILCVDDESVILDSFRKILVLDGYSVDTVESGQEALSLITSHHYDFVFTDLKIPEMDGVDVTKAVKHLRPDIDVIIITGYATVETAVECMKFGAMDYVQKPFTEDELLDFTKKLVFKRVDRVQKQLQPRVHITHASVEEPISTKEFYIPGGVFIAKNHCWVSIGQEGNVKIGIDDFAKKLIGKIDRIEFPNLGMMIREGQILFTIHQGKRSIPFYSPISGHIIKTNSALSEEIEALDFSSYDDNWICTIDSDNLDNELPKLKIGNSAVSHYLGDLDYCRKIIRENQEDSKLSEETQPPEGLYIGLLEALEDKEWHIFVNDFFINRKD